MKPCTEQVAVSKLICPVQLHSGILSAAAARRLDRAQWKLEAENVPVELAQGGVEVPVAMAQDTNARIEEFKTTVEVRQMKLKEKEVFKAAHDKYKRE